MSATYDDGYAAGIDKARRDLAEYQRIALGWAAARIQTIDGRSPGWRSEYDRGYTAGYRSVLVGYIHSQTK